MSLGMDVRSMDLMPSLMNLDCADTTVKLERFINDYIVKSKTRGVVLGLSGGIDSSTAAALAARAIGGDRVIGLLMPEKETYDKRAVEDARKVAKKFKITVSHCDITRSLETLYKELPSFDAKHKVSKGNVKARTRMIYLYYCANIKNLLVLGSSDKSEAMMGYFTKWGDIAADISPLMDLYKTQVQKLATYLGVPRDIVEKPSTPALWPRQMAKDELGIGYDSLDLILYGLEHFLTVEEISAQLKTPKTMICRIKERWLNSEHKRRVILTSKLGYRTIGKDFRLKRG